MLRLWLKLYLMTLYRAGTFAAMMAGCVCGVPREETQWLLAALRDPCPWHPDLDDVRSYVHG